MKYRYSFLPKFRIYFKVLLNIFRQTKDDNRSLLSLQKKCLNQMSYKTNVKIKCLQQNFESLKEVTVPKIDSIHFNTNPFHILIHESLMINKYIVKFISWVFRWFLNPLNPYIKGDSNLTSFSASAITRWSSEVHTE